MPTESFGRLAVAIPAVKNRFTTYGNYAAASVDDILGEARSSAVRVGATTFDRCQQSLKPHGVFLQNIMGLTDIVRILTSSIAGGKKLKGGVALEKLDRMNFIIELAAAGKLKPVIDRSYPLDALLTVRGEERRGCAAPD
jgi:NADPH:quinone reductase-like Zn-dependent oxidoreductase